MTANKHLADIYEQAAEWAEKTAHLTAAEKQQLSLWLAADAIHAKAYQKCLALWQSEEMTQALSGVAKISPQPRPGNKGWRLAISFCLVLVICGISWQWLITPSDAISTFQTRAGETEFYQLPDGSTFTLAGNSGIDFQQTPALRHITLYKGEALFEVTHLGPEQPFVVDSGDTRVTVTGTRFSVEKTPQGAEVTVLEGSVLVSTADNSIALQAGQRVKVQQQAVSAPETLWQGYDHHLTSIWLDVREEPLDSVLRKLERQLTSSIMLTDPALANLKITGRFDIRTPEATLYLLTEASQLRVHRSTGHYVISRQ
ncbi:FecR domain-containing protein [Chromatiaceae bacterium AAb-1]|nr:FecR domain-containing protein [Chromatiaceae bacterium AAb-1]